MFEGRAIATSVSEAGGKIFSISSQRRPFPATPITLHNTPTYPRVTGICRLLILTLLLVEHDIQTLSRTVQVLRKKLLFPENNDLA